MSSTIPLSNNSSVENQLQDIYAPPLQEVNIAHNCTTEEVTTALESAMDEQTIVQFNKLMDQGETLNNPLFSTWKMYKEIAQKNEEKVNGNTSKPKHISHLITAPALMIGTTTFYHIHRQW